METRASYVTVGAFVMICLLGLIVASIWLTGAQYREEYIYFRTYFNGPVTGLGRGTAVRYNGIDVGNVTELAFDPADPKRVIVTLQTQPTLKLHVDSIASIEQQGLTGGNYVEIEGGTANSPLLTVQAGQSYPVIQSKPSTLQELAQTGPQLVDRFNTVGARLSDVLNDENRRSIAELLASLRDTTALVKAHSADLDATLANLKTASGGINTTLASADKTLQAAGTALTAANHAIGTLDTALGSADTTAKKFGKLSDDADKVITGETIAQVTQLLAQARQLITSLNRIASDIEREPTKLLYGDQRQGYTPR